jgi:hypothetical protein
MSSLYRARKRVRPPLPSASPKLMLLSISYCHQCWYNRLLQTAIRLTLERRSLHIHFTIPPYPPEAELNPPLAAAVALTSSSIAPCFQRFLSSISLISPNSTPKLYLVVIGSKGWRMKSRESIREQSVISIIHKIGYTTGMAAIGS